MQVKSIFGAISFCLFTWEVTQTCSIMSVREVPNTCSNHFSNWLVLLLIHASITFILLGVMWYDLTSHFCWPLCPRFIFLKLFEREGNPLLVDMLFWVSKIQILFHDVMKKKETKILAIIILTHFPTPKMYRYYDILFLHLSSHRRHMYYYIKSIQCV